MSLNLPSAVWWIGFWIVMGTIGSAMIWAISTETPEATRDAVITESALIEIVRAGRVKPIQPKPGVVLISDGKGSVYRVSVINFGRNQGRLKVEELKEQSEIH